MDQFIFTICPILQQYPFFLVVAELCFAFFFGGFIFSGFWNLIMTLMGGKTK